MTITTVITYKGYGCLAFQNPVLAMAVFRDLLSENLPYIELRYTKDYPSPEAFKFTDLYNSLGWQYFKSNNHEFFINHRKDTPRKIVRQIGEILSQTLKSYEDYKN